MAAAGLDPEKISKYQVEFEKTIEKRKFGKGKGSSITKRFKLNIASGVLRRTKKKKGWVIRWFLKLLLKSILGFIPTETLTDLIESDSIDSADTS